jgi:hypothetical protein
MHRDKSPAHHSNRGYTGKTVTVDLNVLNFLNTILVLSIRLGEKLIPSLALVANFDN